MKFDGATPAYRRILMAVIAINGAAFLALRSGAPLVPIYIHPSSYRTNRPKLIVGAPIQAAQIVAGLPHSEQAAALTSALEAAILALKDKLQEAL